MNRTLISGMIALALTGCRGTQEDPEAAACQMLEQSRTLMQNKDYQAARDTIEAMRHKHPKAIETRKQGIVVMDSIELLEAQDSLAAADMQLQVEEHILDSISKRNNRGKNSPYYNQKNKVFYMRQHTDELAAKVKFYLKKIERDRQENL